MKMNLEEIRLKGVQDGKPLVQVPEELWRDVIDRFERIRAVAEKVRPPNET
jgi:hypothetical protein